jgi:hypothetical protein
MDFAFEGLTSMDDQRFALLWGASRLRGDDELKRN